MFDVSGYEGKKIIVSLDDGTELEAKYISFILGDPGEDEINSMLVTVTKVIKTKRKNIIAGEIAELFEDEVKNIEVI